MLSKNQIKLINGLNQKKNRNAKKLFVVEGPKAISEFLHSKYKLNQLYTSVPKLFTQVVNQILISDAELKKISQLKTPNKALAVFEIPESQEIDISKLILVLDEINDPGNLGTIIRLCDWFGIEDLICSLNTVDCYNPKVIQATMGSLTRVNVTYNNIQEFLKIYQYPVYGTLLNGENMYKSTFEQKGALLMGNEANGISEEVQKYITHKITIPQFGNIKETESLNVATATAICLSQIKQFTEM